MAQIYDTANALQGGYTNWGQQAGQNILANRLRGQEQQKLNSLGALLPQAMAGDKNALAQAYQLDPPTGLKINALMQNQANTQYTRDQATAKTNAERIRQGFEDEAKGLALLGEDKWESAYPTTRQRLIALDPKTFGALPEVADESVKSYLRGVGGVKPPEPVKPQGPTSGIQEYEYAKQQGYGGTFQQFQVEKARAGASNTSVNYGAPVEGVDAQGNPVFKRFAPGSDSPQDVNGFFPAPKKAEQPTEGERTAAMLLSRLRRADADIKSVGAGSERPGVMATIAGAVSGETARNLANTEDRQMIEAAQMDALDAALTLSTGAAYTKEQLEMQRRSHFPQIGDSKATAAAKNKRFTDLVKDAELKAGRATPPNGPKPNAGPREGSTATNPKTGEKVTFQGGQWVKM